jgi:hypothetical protein
MGSPGNGCQAVLSLSERLAVAANQLSLSVFLGFKFGILLSDMSCKGRKKNQWQ